MSMEAKASAGIIAALPFVVGAPDLPVRARHYIELLWITHDRQDRCWCVSAFWMAIGIFVMKKMINFDI